MYVDFLETGSADDAACVANNITMNGWVDFTPLAGQFLCNFLKFFEKFANRKSPMTLEWPLKNLVSEYRGLSILINLLNCDFGLFRWWPEVRTTHIETGICDFYISIFFSYPYYLPLARYFIFNFFDHFLNLYNSAARGLRSMVTFLANSSRPLLYIYTRFRIISILFNGAQKSIKYSQALHKREICKAEVADDLRVTFKKSSIRI